MKQPIRTPRRKALRALATFTSGVLLATSGTAVLAQTPPYPSKPIHIVVTFPPGGSTDAMVRMLMPRLSERLGQPIVIENKPGAGGNIGLAAVAKAAPDGHMLGLGAAGALAANASLYPQMPFDALKDFRPVGMLAAIPFVIVGNPSLAPKTMPELIAHAKARPGELSMGHGGNGTAMHLSAALLGQMSGTRIVEVPYRGSGPAALDALSGQVPLALVDLPSALQHIKAGTLRAYAVTSPRRLPVLPDVPTVSESGISGYDSTGWFGLVVPAGTPTAVVTRLNTELNAALNDETIRSGMRNLGVEPAPSTPEAFEAYIRSETQKWAGVIKTANIKLQ